MYTYTTDQPLTRDSPFVYDDAREEGFAFYSSSRFLSLSKLVKNIKREYGKELEWYFAVVEND